MDDVGTARRRPSVLVSTVWNKLQQCGSDDERAEICQSKIVDVWEHIQEIQSKLVDITFATKDAHPHAKERAAGGIQVKWLATRCKELTLLVEMLADTDPRSKFSSASTEYATLGVELHACKAECGVLLPVLCPETVSADGEVWEPDVDIETLMAFVVDAAREWGICAEEGYRRLENSAAG
mmetsp:Transcript_11337/g.25786  ORF Transcript_11337/g.25786 Transcript_11337/m.25786 type:complete len:181 (+) Transcript_11337:88-630(+)